MPYRFYTSVSGVGRFSFFHTETTKPPNNEQRSIHCVFNSDFYSSVECWGDRVMKGSPMLLLKSVLQNLPGYNKENVKQEG
jgi:hypothetical protein